MDGWIQVNQVDSLVPWCDDAVVRATGPVQFKESHFGCVRRRLGVFTSNLHTEQPLDVGARNDPERCHTPAIPLPGYQAVLWRRAAHTASA